MSILDNEGHDPMPLNAERQYRYGRMSISDLVLECERLRAALRHLDAMIFGDPQVIERAGEMRAYIWNALEPVVDEQTATKDKT